MTAFEIRDETGRNRRLARRIETIARQAAPLIEETTGLALPLVQFRLVPLQEWIDTAAGQLDDTVTAATESGDPARVDAARATRDHLHTLFTRTWVTVRGFSTTRHTADGNARSEYLMVPEALKRMGLLRARHGVERHTVHEMVHQAQVAASAWAVIPPPPKGDPRITGGRDPQGLACGHADWAEGQVMHQLRGIAPSNRRLYPGLRYWRIALPQYALAVKTEDAAAAAEGRPVRHVAFPRPRVVDVIDPAATHFVGVTVSSAGTRQWNARMWHEMDTVPTPDEITHPAAWLTRMGLAE